MDGSRAKHAGLPVRNRRWSAVSIAITLAMTLVCTLTRAAEAAETTESTTAQAAAAQAAQSALGTLSSQMTQTAAGIDDIAKAVVSSVAGFSVAVSGDQVTLSTPLPEGFDRGQAKSWVADANGRNPQLSDTIQEHLNAYPLDLPGGTPQVHDFDGSFSLTDKGLKLTFTSGEALTRPTWWQSTLLAAGFYALGLAFRTACMLGVIASTGGVASVLAKTACASVAGFLGAFLFRLVSFKLDGKKLDADAWGDILCVALAGALVSSGAWEGLVGPWVANSGQAFMNRVGTWLTQLGGAIARGWGQAGEAATAVGEAIRDWAAEFPAALRNAVDRLTGVTGAGSVDGTITAQR
ncbi:conserved membrane hypothetical protein [Frankia sp. Hr75.2]|nr:conserved membrane hypothetical protein [Frankia sp. Hr75.2]SQD97837.1 membrane hypothetical protein [Parafrankia sp. Ea1.12]